MTYDDRLKELMFLNPSHSSGLLREELNAQDLVEPLLYSEAKCIEDEQLKKVWDSFALHEWWFRRLDDQLVMYTSDRKHLKRRRYECWQHLLQLYKDTHGKHHPIIYKLSEANKASYEYEHSQTNTSLHEQINRHHR